MKKEKVILYGGLVFAAWLVVKAYNMPQVQARPVYQRIKSPEVYDRLYTDSHLTDVSGGQGG